MTTPTPRVRHGWIADVDPRWVNILQARMGIPMDCLAWAMFVDFSTLYRWSRGERRPPPVSIALGAELLKLPTSVLFDLGTRLHAHFRDFEETARWKISGMLLLCEVLIKRR